MNMPLLSIQSSAMQTTRIHPTAVVSSSARIGRGVTIGPQCFIDEQVVIGDGCVIGPQACILRHTTLGARCQVHARTVLGDVPQDRSFAGGDSYVVIGDDCILREGVTIHRGTQPGSTTRLGNGCLLMAGAHVAHNCVVGEQVTLINNATLAGHVHVGDRAVLSANCLVHQFTRIGRLAMLAGASGVQMDVPPFCMTQSMNTNTIVGLNVVGLRRAEFSPDERREIKAAFNVLYRSGLLVPQAVERLEREFHSPHVRELVDFIKGSKRGICKFVRDAEAEPQELPATGPRLMAA